MIKPFHFLQMVDQFLIFIHVISQVNVVALVFIVTKFANECAKFEGFSVLKFCAIMQTLLLFASITYVNFFDDYSVIVYQVCCRQMIVKFRCRFVSFVQRIANRVELVLQRHSFCWSRLTSTTASLLSCYIVATFGHSNSILRQPCRTNRIIGLIHLENIA